MQYLVFKSSHFIFQLLPKRWGRERKRTNLDLIYFFQIEGAFVQGIGLFTLEELRYSPEGNLYTRGPGMYKIPAFGDIPSEFHVSLLRDCPNSKAIYSSKVNISLGNTFLHLLINTLTY